MLFATFASESSRFRILGILTLIFELSPLLTRILKFGFLETVAHYNGGKPLWYRSIVYAGFVEENTIKPQRYFSSFGIISLIAYAMCPAAGLIVNCVFYLCLAVIVFVIYMMFVRGSDNG